jgi:hypothetical protein
MKIRRIFSVILVACANSCTCQSPKPENCKVHYENSKQNLNSFYKSGDSLSLVAALNEVEPAMECSVTRPAAVLLKITILQQLRRYEQGFMFIDSLSINDFKPQYLKDVYFKLFKALQFEKVGDTITRNAFYTSAEANLLEYIKNEHLPSDQIDEEAYAHYLFFRSKLLTKEQTGNEIDSIYRQCKINRDFFEAMHFQFADTSKPIPPTVSH